MNIHAAEDREKPTGPDGNIWAEEINSAAAAFAADRSLENYGRVLSLLLVGMYCGGKVRGRFPIQLNNTDKVGFETCEARPGEQYMVMLTRHGEAYRYIAEETLITAFFSFNRDDFAGLVINPNAENIVIEKEFFYSALRLFYAGIRFGEENKAENA